MSTLHSQRFSDWIKKYLKLLAKYSEKYKADVGNIWHSDETTVFIKKEGEKKILPVDLERHGRKDPLPPCLSGYRDPVCQGCAQAITDRQRKPPTVTRRNCDRWITGIQ